MQKCPDNLTPLDDGFYDWFFTEKTYMSESDLNQIKDTIKVLFKRFYSISKDIVKQGPKLTINTSKERKYITELLLKENNDNYHVYSTL